jgi:hypothetical protein
MRETLAKDVVIFIVPCRLDFNVFYDYNMAKSLRSKSKRAWRKVKRTSAKSDYAVADALRTQRLSAKLRATAIGAEDDDGFETEDEGAEKGVLRSVLVGTMDLTSPGSTEEMEIDSAGAPTSAEASGNAGAKVTTSGKRDSNAARRKGTKKSKAVFSVKGGKRGKPRK